MYKAPKLLNCTFVLEKQRKWEKGVKKRGWSGSSCSSLRCSILVRSLDRGLGSSMVKYTCQLHIAETTIVIAHERNLYNDQGPDDIYITCGVMFFIYGNRKKIMRERGSVHGYTNHFVLLKQCGDKVVWFKKNKIIFLKGRSSQIELLRSQTH